MSPRLISVLLALALAVGLAACGSGSESSTTAPPTTESTGATGKSAESAGSGGKPANGGTGERTSHKGAASNGGKGSEASGSGHKHSGAAVPGENTHFTPPAHNDSGGGAGQFETKGGDNSIQEAGGEASGSEFEEAAAALHAYLDARAAGAWAVACEYLAPGVYAQLAGQGGGAGCPEVLAGISAGVPPSALREVAVADVGSFRVEGDSGFLLFHGAQGIDWFAPMVREDGAWKVAAIAPSALG